MNKRDHTERPKRFWKTAEDGPAAAAGRPILLDGRPARTPGRAPLLLPTEALARRVAEEWSAVGEHLDFAAMPLTRLAFTAIDRIAGAREAVADEVARFAQADVLCYFATTPAALVERQLEHWGPVLGWAERDLGLRFQRATGIEHVAQPDATLARVRALALEGDDFVLAGLAWAAALFGSAILALAVQRRELDAETAFDLSRLDEVFQAEFWGEDAEAAARTRAMRAEAAALELWFEALT